MNLFDKNGVNNVNRVCETCPRHVENQEFYWCCECFNKQSPDCYTKDRNGKWRYGSDGKLV